MTRYLIVNADDFGLAAGVSEGILAASRVGIVTSATAVVNREIPPGQIRALLDSGIGIGLHVNFTLGVPLTRARSLMDESGRFFRDPHQVAARARAGDLERELAAQIERFEALFRRSPTHLDSHHHVALHPPVREIVLRGAARLGVPVRSQTAAARRMARAAGLATPDHFFGESGPGPYWTPARSVARLRRLPAGVSEFMTHPGFSDDELASSRYRGQREIEVIGLGSAARAAARALGIVLCDFRRLASAVVPS